VPRRLGLIVSRLPSLESGEAPRLTTVAVEDLLLRPSENIDYARLEALVKDKSVIVTGAALRWMGGITSPLLLAVFLAVMVDGFARVIRRRAPFLPLMAPRSALLMGVFALALEVALISPWVDDAADSNSTVHFTQHGLIFVGGLVMGWALRDLRLASLFTADRR